MSSILTIVTIIQKKQVSVGYGGTAKEQLQVANIIIYNKTLQRQLPTYIHNRATTANGTKCAATHVRQQCS